MKKSMRDRSLFVSKQASGEVLVFYIRHLYSFHICIMLYSPQLIPELDLHDLPRLEGLHAKHAKKKDLRTPFLELPTISISLAYNEICQASSSVVVSASSSQFRDLPVAMIIGTTLRISTLSALFSHPTKRKKWAKACRPWPRRAGMIYNSLQ
jgi:hypothetical protein